MVNEEEFLRTYHSFRYLHIIKLRWLPRESFSPLGFDVCYCIRPATVCGVSPRMRLDVSVNMLTYQALKNGKVTVFGGSQTRPNIPIDDICDVYRFF